MAVSADATEFAPALEVGADVPGQGRNVFERKPGAVMGRRRSDENRVGQERRRQGLSVDLHVAPLFRFGMIARPFSERRMTPRPLPLLTILR